MVGYRSVHFVGLDPDLPKNFLVIILSLPKNSHVFASNFRKNERMDDVCTLQELSGPYPFPAKSPLKRVKTYSCVHIKNTLKNSICSTVILLSQHLWKCQLGNFSSRE